MLARCFVFMVMFHPVGNSEVSIIYPHFIYDENVSKGRETPWPFLLGTVLSHVCCPRIIINKPFFPSQKFGMQIIWLLCVKIRVWGWVISCLAFCALVGGRNFLGIIFVLYFCSATRLYFSASKAREKDSLLISWALPEVLLAVS